MIKTIKSDIKNLIVDIKIYNHQDTEIEYMYNLIQNLKKIFKLNIFDLKNMNKQKSFYSNEIEKKITNYLIDRTKYNYYNPPKTYTVSEWNKLNSLYNNGKIRNSFDNLINEYLEINDNINLYKDDIIKWCNYNNLNSNTIINYLNEYKKIFLEFITLNKNTDSKINIIDPFTLMENESTSFKKSLLNKNKLENVIRPFIHGYPLNIAVRDKSCYYLFKLNKSSNNNNSNSLIYYYNFNDNNNQMNITNKIDIEWLINAAPQFYRPSNLKTKINQDHDFYLQFKNKYHINNLPYESSNDMLILKKYIKYIKTNNLSYDIF
jgi:hypothetical protein